MTTRTRDDKAIFLGMLGDCPDDLLIAELERRGWEKGRLNVGAEAFDVLALAVELLPFEFVPDFGDEALSA